MKPTDTSGVTTQGASFLATLVNHPRLIRTDPDSIRTFLCLYDQYAREVTARAAQVTVTGTNTEPVRPVSLKFCVDPEHLESAIALNLIKDAESYETLTDTVLRKYLEKEAEDSKESLSLETLDDLVNRELRMEMSNRNARSRMQTLFVAYHKLLRRHGLSWVLEQNQKVAIGHVFSAVRPKTLQDRLESDLQFAKTDCRKYFAKFMEHAVRLSEAFQLLDNGPKSPRDKPNKNRRGKNRGGTGDKHEPESRKDSSGKHGSKSGKGDRKLPDCPYGPCAENREQHLIKDCPRASYEEESKMLAELNERKLKDAPAQSTRSKKGSASEPKSGGTVGRMAAKPIPDDSYSRSPSCPISVSDGLTSLDTTGRCDDGSDDSIVSPKFAERAVIQGIGRMTAIQPVRLRVALKSGEEAQSFSFSRSWTSPRTVMHLASGQLALANVTFLVADEDLVCEPLIIGLPVLQHLLVDTRSLLENNRAVLDGADCSHIGNPTTGNRGGTVSRMMIARLNRSGPKKMLPIPGQNLRRIGHASTTIPQERKKTRSRISLCSIPLTRISTPTYKDALPL